MVKLVIPLFLALSILILPLPSFAHQNAADSTAQQAAEHFLQLIDNSEFQLAFSQTSLINQNYIQPPEWFNKLVVVRPYLGQASSRVVKTTSYHTGWVGLPDGEYIRISFATVFTNKQNSLESVVLFKEGNSWRVSSYHLR